MNLKEPTIQELSERGKRALCDELGVANTIRFLQSYNQGSGDYTKERLEQYSELSLETIVEDIQAKRKDAGGQ